MINTGIKRLLLFLLSAAVMLSLCSCGNAKYLGMKNYLNANTDLQIVSVSDWEYNKETKAVLLCIELKKDSRASLEKLDGLRKAVNEYMQKKGGFLEQGWQVSVYVDEAQFMSSKKPYRYAVMANFESGFITVDGKCNYETSDHLNTMMFYITSSNADYISSLTDVEHIYIVGDLDKFFAKTVEELRKLDNLKTLKVYTDYYEKYVEAGLKCNVEKTSSFDL